MSARTLLTAMLSVGSAVVAVYAQPPRQAYPSLRVVGADTTSAARTYRIYDNPAEILLALSIGNDSRSAYAIRQADLVGAVNVRLLKDIEMPLAIAWRQLLTAGDRAPRPVSPEEDVRVDPGRALEWHIVLSQPDRRPFENGMYAIRVSMGDALRRARTDDGSLWGGRIAVTETDLFVQFGPPSEFPRERAAALRQRGRSAQARNHDQEALQTFRAAVEADATDVLSLIALGDAYLRSNQFRNAVPVFEQVLRLVPDPRSPVSTKLAVAYLGAEDEENAVRILRTTGISDGRVEAEIGRIRAMIRQQR